MKIILGKPDPDLASKYLVLELDTIKVEHDIDPVTAYCVIDGSHIYLDEMAEVERYAAMHQALMENYRQKKWNFCEQAIRELTGKFRGEMDSFYKILLERIQSYKKNDPGLSWDGTLLIVND